MQTISKLIRAQPPLPTPPGFSPQLPCYKSNFGRKSTGIRFQKGVAAGTNRPDEKGSEMDVQDVKKQDTMSSFGEGYATRSDEEGFGGVYGGNQDDPKEKEKEKDHHEFDKKQGSEVKEQEKSRHQKDPTT